MKYGLLTITATWSGVSPVTNRAFTSKRTCSNETADVVACIHDDVPIAGHEICHSGKANQALHHR